MEEEVVKSLLTITEYLAEKPSSIGRPRELEIKNRIQSQI